MIKILFTDEQTTKMTVQLVKRTDESKKVEETEDGKVSFENIPSGEYKIVYTYPDGYKFKGDGDTYKDNGSEISLIPSKEVQTIKTRLELKTGNLKVSKTIDGANARETDEFEIQKINQKMTNTFTKWKHMVHKHLLTEVQNLP